MYFEYPVNYSSTLDGASAVVGGFVTCPENMMTSARLSMIKKRKGWSTMKGWTMGMLRFIITTAVAAAASDPSSLTSTIAFTHTHTHTQNTERN